MGNLFQKKKEEWRGEEKDEQKDSSAIISS